MVGCQGWVVELRTAMGFSGKICLVLLVFFCERAGAQMQWEQPSQQFRRAPQDEGLDVRYRFRNGGREAVTVVAIKPACGCTSVQLEKKTYRPGESGEIEVRFTFGGREGEQWKTIEVETDPPYGAATVVDLRVTIHDPLKLETSLVFWRCGDGGEAKAVQITATASEPVQIKRVISSNPRIEVKLETVKVGEHYVVTVRPTDTSRKESAEIFLIADVPEDAPRTYILHARVK